MVSLVFRISLFVFAVHPQEYGEFLVTRAGELAAGGWLAIAYRGPEWARVQRAAPLLFAAGLIGFCSAGWSAHSFAAAGLPMMAAGLTAMTVVSAALLAMSLRPGVTATVTNAPLLRWIGGLSFGIYVYHVLFAGLFESIAGRLAGDRSVAVRKAVLFLVAAFGSVGFAWLSYNFYERYFLRLKTRLKVRLMESGGPYGVEGADADSRRE